MSFTQRVQAELLALPTRKMCCHKAWLFGLLYGCPVDTEEGLVACFANEEVASLACRLLEKLYHETPALQMQIRNGRSRFLVSVQSKKIKELLRRADDAQGEELASLVGFRCEACKGNFLGGAVLSCATFTDPHKGYHMEIALPNEQRALKLAELMETIVKRPGTVRRKKSVGLYYKSNGSISDFLYCIGCTGASFDVTNACIERDIRNYENRATNCVTSNISRSVDAARKQISAIEALASSGKLDGLAPELRDTARLRIENETASLWELAQLHEPPLTKSGLNRRLQRLMEIAREEGF